MWQALRLATPNRGLPALRAEVAAWCLQTLDNRAPVKPSPTTRGAGGHSSAAVTSALRADDALSRRKKHPADDAGFWCFHDHVVSIFPGYQSL